MTRLFVSLLVIYFTIAMAQAAAIGRETPAQTNLLFYQQFMDAESVVDHSSIRRVSSHRTPESSVVFERQEGGIFVEAEHASLGDKIRVVLNAPREGNTKTIALELGYARIDVELYHDSNRDRYVSELFTLIPLQ